MAAENDHEEAMTQAESDEMIASAHAAYDNATASSQVEATMVTTVGLAGSAQSGGPDGLGYILSEAWLTPLVCPVKVTRSLPTRRWKNWCPATPR